MKLKPFIAPLLIIAGFMLCFSVVFACVGVSPLEAAQVIVNNALFSTLGSHQTLFKASLLILTGLAVALPYQAGLFNIGGEGQGYAGGMAAAWLGVWPLMIFGPLHWIVCLLIGAAAGAGWAFIAAWLKAKRNVHEVISTIMLNFIALFAVNEIVFSKFNADGTASRTPAIMPSARTPEWLYIDQSGALIGMPIAILAALAFSILLHRSRWGFLARAAGRNPSAAFYAGLKPDRWQTIALVSGGALAGLAGALEITGMNHAFYARFSGGMGFDGIAVAFLALCEPWATIPAALVLAALRAGDRSLQLELGAPKETVFIIEGLMIVAIALAARRRWHER